MKVETLERWKVEDKVFATRHWLLVIGHWSLVVGHWSCTFKIPLNTELLLGIDGGGSKTHALLADHAGNVLGSGTAPSSNYQAVGMAAAITAVQQAIAAARVDAGIDPQTEIAAACVAWPVLIGPGIGHCGKHIWCANRSRGV